MRVRLTYILAAATFGSAVASLVVSTVMPRTITQEELVVSVTCPAPAGNPATLSIYAAGGSKPLQTFPVTAFRICGPPWTGVAYGVQPPEYAEANGHLYYLGQGGSVLEYRKPGSIAVTIELLIPDEEVLSTS